MNAFLFNIQKFSVHDGPGIRTSIFFKGCNLRCRWCANPESQCAEPQTFTNTKTGEVSPVGKAYSIADIMHEVLKDKAFYEHSGGGVTLTGGEVFLQLDFALELCAALQKEKIHIAIETAGAVPLPRFQSLVGQVDLIYMDLKHYNDQKHKDGTGISNDQILQNMAWAARHTNLIVRIPVIPGFNDRLEDAKAFGTLLAQMDVPQVQLLPFHQMGDQKYNYLGWDYAYANQKALTKEALEPFREIIANKGVNVKNGAN
ncbi:MAG: glycyl-radical enzyme activating protein [Lachnospiraceae bacterium]|nr:glycyl-radical enzyme activating protein [Lachnospiraceae bacterium]